MKYLLKDGKVERSRKRERERERREKEKHRVFVFGNAMRGERRCLMS